MKGFESEDLYGPVTEEHRQLYGVDYDERDDYYDKWRLVDYVAYMAVYKRDAVLLRFMLDKGAYPNSRLWYMGDDCFICDRILIDAGYKAPLHEMCDKNKHFIVSRNSARLAAILTMRGMFQKGPAQMVGRAIWESRAYYLEEK